MVNRELVDALRAGLAARADPGRAEGMRAYMKSAMPYLGVMSTSMRELHRDVFATFPIASFDEWRDTVLAMWDEARFREERYSALALTGYRRYKAFRTLEAVSLIERLIVAGAWWDLVDGLATHEIGDLLRRYPAQMRGLLLAWSRGSDPWLRRTSIICQVGFRRETDQDLLYACIEPSLGERGFFLRKAIGWALREYAKSAPDEVRRYVEANSARLSGLSRREALKHLGAGSTALVRLHSGAASV
jgi:3-methyladenine DNA glycosylase AlkD